MVRRVLMVAYHYPPQAGSSGVQRTLKFSQYLAQHGWEPTVLTAHPRAYPRVSAEPSAHLTQPNVHRAFALDAANHLAIRGRYLQLSALPDRWATWWLGAVPLGLRLAREHRFDAIWSTYPIATAHMIAHTLHRRTGIPWIADFRDPMTEPGYPVNPRVRRAYARVEATTLAHCAHAVFTAPGARAAYLGRFPAICPERFSVIENGYDEDDFADAVRVDTPDTCDTRPVRPFVLLHSGIVYPSERDPSALFIALARLHAAGILGAHNFKLVLRAPVHEATLQGMIAQHAIGAIVTLAPPLPYSEALSEMLSADALLLLQGADCNRQIPAKAYEYLRAQRPILSLTDPAGDTAWTMRRADMHAIARLDSAAEIVAALPEFIAAVRQGAIRGANLAAAQCNSRQHRTGELARLFDRVVAGPGGQHG